MNTEIYTVKALKEVLQLGERTIKDALRNGSLVGHKKHGQWYVLHHDLIQYITT